MGEWSRKIGEVGEKTVSDFMNMIGWGDAQHNLTLPCIQRQRHSTADGERKTHGIDHFFSHQSNLVDRTLDHLVISVKYSASAYPVNPNAKFKEHFLDLAKTLECFRKSDLRNTTGKHFSGISIARNIGVLFWLTNDRANQDVISKLAELRKIDEYAYETIFVVDDYRASFIYDSIRFVKNMFSGEDKVEFLYPSTGRNLNPTTRESSGKILPVEFINSPILPFRIEKKDGGKVLAMTCIEDFNTDHLRRLIGLAQNITQDFAKETLLLFPDYDKLRHENQVGEAKTVFENKSFTESVKVGSLRTGFREVK